MRRLALLGSCLLVLAGAAENVPLLPGECWWGAANRFGLEMPFDESTQLMVDLRSSNYDNQCAPFLVSSQGRVIWTEEQCVFVISNGVISVDSPVGVSLERPGSDLPTAYRAAVERHFPPSGKMPDPLFFSAPQLNTWIELTYRQNEKDILAYAETMLSNGVPPGVFMIDDTWQAGYGDWRFESSRFDRPKQMVARLHEQGYKVMLWMCPYVGMDTPAFRRVAWGVNPDDVRGYPVKGGFLMQRSVGEPSARKWWNGYSAFLDFAHPNARAWFGEVLDGLVRDYGVDGFKFDGGDLSAYDLSACRSADGNATSGSLNGGYADFALRYPICELRNLWRRQQIPAVVRLHDKPHHWSSLPRLVADMIAAGLLGYPFICPDMVGGGEWTSFLPGAAFDPELFIRSAQVHALCPMMQISASPWRVLSAEHQEVFRTVIRLRQSFAPKIVELAKAAGNDGEPILRSMEYNFPNRGYAKVRDQFMMGRDLIVAPVLEKGSRSRTVRIPDGRWRADDGEVFVGPRTVRVEAPLSRVPYFERDLVR